MPGPPLSPTFTYNGTPGTPALSAPANTLAREVIQSNRFFDTSLQLGTHSRTDLRVNIPNNSGLGIGASGGGVIATESSVDIGEE